MPVYRVQLADGRIVRLEGPPNASESDLLNAIEQSSMIKDSPRAAPQEPGASIAENLPLRPFGLNTGITMPGQIGELLAGAGRRLSEIGTFGRHRPAEEAEKALDKSGWATAGGVVPDILAISAGGGLLGGIKGAGAIANAARTAGTALTAPRNLLQAASAAGTYGALTDPDRAQGAAGGAVGGAAGKLIGSLLGRAISPRIGPAARRLLDEGGTLTPGDLAGGTLQRIEHAATSTPILGDAIRGAQKRSIQAFNKTMVNDALEEIGEKIQGKLTGHDLLRKADEIISDRYDDILVKMDVRIDAKFVQDMNSLVRMVDSLPDSLQKRFSKIVSDTVIDRFNNPNGLMLGKTFKEADSALRYQYKRFLKSPDPLQQDVGDALRTAHLHLMDLAERQNPNYSPIKKSLDVAYAKMKRIKEAANYTSTESGEFTPATLLRRIQQNSSTDQFARGQGFNQKMVEDYKNLLAQKIPDSGTTGRAIMNLLTFGGLGAVNPGMLGGLLAASSLYTRPGQAAITPLLTSRPAWAPGARSLLEAAAPRIGTGIGLQVAQ